MRSAGSEGYRFDVDGLVRVARRGMGDLVWYFHHHIVPVTSRLVACFAHLNLNIWYVQNGDIPEEPS